MIAAVDLVLRVTLPITPIIHKRTGNVSNQIGGAPSKRRPIVSGHALRVVLQDTGEDRGGDTMVGVKRKHLEQIAVITTNSSVPP
jgi:hypothetical protein